MIIMILMHVEYVKKNQDDIINFRPFVGSLNRFWVYLGKIKVISVQYSYRIFDFHSKPVI